MNDDYSQRVTITGVRIPFWQMVELLVIVAIAAIPAVIVLAFVAGAIWMVVLSLLLA